MQTTYWRLDHTGARYESGHQSVVQDGSEEEEGTSSWESLARLLHEESHGLADYARGAVQIAELAGDFIGSGHDGEPLIDVTATVAVWRHPSWDGARRHLPATDLDCSSRDIDSMAAIPAAELLAALGFERVEVSP